MAAAVRFSTYGGPDVLELVEVETRRPEAGEVMVAVIAAGLNPGEIGIREGTVADRYPARFPEGQGSDFAGLIAAVGPGVTSVCVGDAVIGFSDDRNAQAEFVTVPADRVIEKPDTLDWQQAAGLYVVGTTAWACVEAVGVSEGDTVVVCGGAGGVGVMATQLAISRGARVIVTARREHHRYLQGLLAEPVAYGAGVDDRIRALAPDGVDAFIDACGDSSVELAVRLGVAPDRINTIIDFEAAERFGTKAWGQSSVEAAPVLRELAELLSRREIEVPVYASYPLERVREAYERVAQGRGLGKVVIDVRSYA